MKMLFCSDGSAQAENAIRFGAIIAAACNADATILGVTEFPGELDKILDALKRGLQMLKEKNIAAELITKSGEPIEEIVKRTQEAYYDLVVIGAVRKGTEGPFWMSAKAYKIIKAIKPPVLTVIGRRTELKRVLICTGGRPQTNNAVALAGKIAQCSGAAISVLHVLPDAPEIYNAFSREEDVNQILKSSSQLGQTLSLAKKNLEALGCPTEILVKYGLVMPEILSELHAGKYDLIVAGSSHTRGPLETYMMGDVTREIVNRADCPVLIVRGGEGLTSFIKRFKEAFVRTKRQTPAKPEPPTKS